MRRFIAVVIVVALVVGIGLFAAIYGEPLKDQPNYKAQVACNSVRKERADSGGGTTNDAKVRCIRALEVRYEANPNAELGPLARCVLDAADDAEAARCR